MLRKKRKFNSLISWSMGRQNSLLMLFYTTWYQSDRFWELKWQICYSLLYFFYKELYLSFRIGNLRIMNIDRALRYWKWTFYWRKIELGLYSLSLLYIRFLDFFLDLSFGNISWSKYIVTLKKTKAANTSKLIRILIFDYQTRLITRQVWLFKP